MTALTLHRTTLAFASLLLASCGGGQSPPSDDIPVCQPPECRPQPAPPVYSYPPVTNPTVPDSVTLDPMQPGNWEIGPIIEGTNYSSGVPLRPSYHPNGYSLGWVIDIPTNGKLGYVTMPSHSLKGKSKITMRYRIEGDPSVVIKAASDTKFDGMLTLYFQRQDDDWQATASTETSRWWATFATKFPLKVDNQEHEIVAPLDGNWTAVMTSSAQNSPAAFETAKASAGRIGFTFGGGTGYGHGIVAMAGGQARFVLTYFRVE